MELALDSMAPMAVAFIMVVARMSGLFLVAPLIASPLLPMRVRLMMLVVFSAMLTPVMATGYVVPDSGSVLALGIGQEVIIGLAMGYAVSLIFAAIQVGANMIDLSSGFALANVVDPLSQSQGAVFGAFYTIVASLIFLAMNGHHMLIEGFVASYQLVPMNGQLDVGALMSNLYEQFGLLFANAFRIAAPVIVTLLLTDVVLGLVARVVPQMNVFFLGLPAKIGLGMTAIVLSLPMFAQFFEARITDIAAGVAVLAGA